MPRNSHPEDFIVGEPLIMFHFGKSIGNDLSAMYPADVYAAARGWWRFNPEGTLETHRLVLARDSERVLVAFRPK